MPGGRPSLYVEDYCQKIEEHMRQGFSASTFGAIVGVDKETIHNWKREHPEFFASIKRGQTLRHHFWEKRLLTADKSNAIPVIFALKNIEPEEWRDRREIEMSGQVVAFEPSLLLAAAEVARKLQEKPQIIDVQTVEPKQIVDQIVKNES